jgi:hypothetical protein
MTAAADWWRRLGRWLARRRPHRRHARLVRRVHAHCPRTGELVALEIELGDTLDDRRILRCSAHAEQPPPCDQRCKFSPEALLGPADALIILPEGCRDTVEED